MYRRFPGKAKVPAQAVKGAKVRGQPCVDDENYSTCHWLSRWGDAANRVSAVYPICIFVDLLRVNCVPHTYIQSMVFFNECMNNHCLE